MADFQNYPKWKYKEGEAPRLVNTHVEEADLGDTWFDKPDGTNHAFDQEAAANSSTPPGYQPKEYPKWQYAREYPGGRIVHSEEEENALDQEVTWYDKPDFTNFGEDSTDTTSMVSTSNVKNPPFDALSGPNVLAPVPEMKQGAAKTRASNIAQMDDNADEDNEDVDDGVGVDDGVDDDNEENEDAAEAAGEAENNFDQANGTNPGDAAPEGENPNGPTGRITKPAAEKDTATTVKKTAEETKKTAKATGAKKPAAKKDADDLL